MEIEENKTFRPPWYLFNKHIETIFPVLFRKVDIQPHYSEKIDTPDNDFIDVDYYDIHSEKTVILCHGLEGNAHKPYIKGMVNILLKYGYNCIAWNFRGCSGITNNHAYSYHSGATEDLTLVINNTIEKFPKTDLFLIGFSLGGNLILKYLGERPQHLSIKRAVAISTPLDLHSSCEEISKSSNFLYTIRFLHTLKKKIKIKAKIFPEEINLTHIDAIKDLQEFDDVYTAPLHGFRNAMDYYSKCSSIHFLDNINIPTLLINALNDPFLSSKCYPRNINEKYITYDYPLNGGHMGFKMSNDGNRYYHEIKSVYFLSK